MYNNTPQYHSGDSPGSQPLPQLNSAVKYYWPRPGLDDWPRLSWESWLRTYSLELSRTYQGDLGFFLGQHVLALAEHARILNAHSPTHHITLASEAANNEAAYVASLEAAMEDVVWETELSDDETGGFDGHEAQPDFDGPDTDQIRGWIPRDSEDETFFN